MPKKQKTKYTAKELKEFEKLILDKIKDAQGELDFIKESLLRKNLSGTDSTQGALKTLEDGTLLKSFASIFVSKKYFNKNKGEITLFFNKNNYNLNGWRLVDINNNITLLKIENLIKNSDIKKNFFLIREENQ